MAKTHHFDPNQPTSRPMGKGQPPGQPMGPAIQQMHLSQEAIQSAEDMQCQGQVPLIVDGEIVPDKTIPCNGNIFVEAHRLKYISRILSPAGKETVANILIGKMCTTCGKIFSPDEWMKQKTLKEKAVKGTILDKGGKADG